ncbi:MAG TPA: SHOCT domain-containing protein [Candidatus Dormibacteraeota bacterium]|nr:SHOCT domain-containing protein [Candidatus Dormibacteraeota bacterium]
MDEVSELMLKVLLQEYPFLSVMWTLLVIFAWVIWFWLLIVIFADLFRRHDVSGWGKAAWVILLIVLPFLGVLVYLISQSKGMAERQARQAQASQAQFDQYVRSVAASGSPASQIESAKQLLDKGSITREEFEEIKRKAIASA